MTTEEHNLVAVLREQHRELKEQLSRLGEASLVEPMDAPAITASLVEFRGSLGHHLSLEDTTFYPELLSLERGAGSDTTPIEQFIAKMQDIAVQVNAFLDAYSTSESIDGDPGQFQGQLKEISVMLVRRVDAEERFVYSRWQHLKS